MVIKIRTKTAKELAIEQEMQHVIKGGIEWQREQEH